MKKLLFLILLASSCAPVYVPNVRNSPMFTKGGEFQTSMQLGNGLDVQGALSVSKHIGIMGNYSFADRDRNFSDDPEEFHRHQLLEGGLGYFENDGAWCFEIFAGYGKGEGANFADYNFFNTTSNATGKFERYFIQPAFGLNKKVMNVSFVSRISMLDFTSFSNDVATVIVDSDPKVFIEPAVIGRVNMANDHVFFTFQGGFVVPASADIYFDYRPFQVSTGLGFRFGGMKRDDVKNKNDIP